MCKTYNGLRWWEWFADSWRQWIIYRSYDWHIKSLLQQTTDSINAFTTCIIQTRANHLKREFKYSKSLTASPKIGKSVMTDLHLLATVLRYSRSFDTLCMMSALRPPRLHRISRPNVMVFRCDLSLAYSNTNPIKSAKPLRPIVHYPCHKIAEWISHRSQFPISTSTFSHFWLMPPHAMHCSGNSLWEWSVCRPN